MKKKLLILASVLLVLVLVAVVCGFIFLDSIVKTGVETVGPQITRTSIKLGSVHVSPFSGRTDMSDFVLGNPEGYQTPSAMQMKDMKVSLDLMSLTKDVIVVKEISIINPEITWEGGLSENNFSKLLANVQAATGGGKSEAKPAEQAAPASEASKPMKKICIREFTFKGAKLNVSLTGLGGKKLALVMPDIHLTNIGNESGVTMVEATSQIITEISKNAGKAVAESLANVNNLGKDATQQVDQTLKGFKKLLGK